MKKQVFSMYDEKGGFFAKLILLNRDAEAVRIFSDVVNDKNPSNMIANHPGDFKLYKLGEFDDSSGKIMSLDKPEYIAVGSDFVKVTD